MNTKPLERLQLRVTKEQQKFVRDIAKTKSISEAQVVRDILQDKIDRANKKK